MPIQRIAQSARIPIKIYMKKFNADSPQGLKAEMSLQFKQMLASRFESKGFVTRKEIASFFKKLLPDLNLRVVKHDKVAVKFKLANKGEVVEGYTLRLPFTFTDSSAQIIDKNDFKRISNVYHESDHLMRFVTKPKYLLPYAKGGLSTQLDNLQWGFYNDFLYNNDISALPVERMLKLENSPKNRALYVKQLMINFFEDYMCNSDEKIKLLQKWRYCLKDETQAFFQGGEAEMNYKYPISELSHKIRSGKRIKLSEEFFNTYNTVSYDSKVYSAKEEKLEALESFIEKVKIEKAKDTQQNFFFAQKIKIIESMLFEEMTNVRAEQKRLFGDV